MPGPRDESLVVKKNRSSNTTPLYALAAIYIALTEAITATFGKSVEPLANSLIKDILPQMPTDAAEVCARLTSGDRTAGNQTDRLS